MDLDEDAAGEAEQGLGVGEDPDDVGAAFDLFVDPLEGVGRPDLLPVRDREVGEGGDVSAASRSIASTLGNCRPSMVAITSSCSRTCSASGWAKMVRIAAATIVWEPLGTWASTLRRKCTRQRCQVAPSITAAMAALSPAWASEITSLVPVSPRVLSERRNAVQKAPSSESPTANPRTSRRPSEVTPVATTIAWETTREPLPLRAPPTRALQ